jgi:hypothetical protein
MNDAKCGFLLTHIHSIELLGKDLWFVSNTTIIKETDNVCYLCYQPGYIE